MPQAPARRELAFQDLDEVVRDAEALAAGGYVRAGNWDLAQVCGHLTDWLRYPLDGYPRPALPVRVLLWGLRQTVGRKALKDLLAGKPMPAGGPTMRETIPPPGGDERAAVDDLRAVVARFREHNGPLHPSPLFGPMDHATATKLQLTHSAHHLSFLIPRDRP